MRNDRPWRVEDTVGVADRIRSLRTSPDPFDIAVPGETDPNDTSRVDRHHEHEVAGATWWIEAVHPWRYGWGDGRDWPMPAMRERIDAGP